MQLFRKKAKATSRVGLLVTNEHLVLVHVDKFEGRPRLLHCECVALANHDEAVEKLQQLVKQHDLEGKQVSYVLNPRDYHLHLVEAPRVEPEEMRAATRWKVKDLLDMRLEDAVIDIFPVPEKAYRGRQMIYVVAALSSRIKSIVHLVNQVELELAVIDIPELVTNNLVTRFLDDSRGLAFMDLRRGGSTMNISRGGDLYLTRRINTQLDDEVIQTPGWESLKYRLVVEIERSLDYYESQMGQEPIEHIVIAPRRSDTLAMVEQLDQLLPVRVSALQLADHLQSQVTLTPARQQLAMMAIGATLRGSQKSGDADQQKQEAA